jgi:hypothetical protein
MEWMHLEMKEQEIDQKAKINGLEQEHVINTHKIDQLERYLGETKQNLNHIYAFNSELLTG